MAHFIGCCCPECVPRVGGCNESNTGVAGGICHSDATPDWTMPGPWELELSGLQVNTDYCVQSATCSHCNKPKGSPGGGGPNTCHRPSFNSQNDCYVQPLDDLNGTYLVQTSGCCWSRYIYVWSGTTTDDEYQCPSCAGISYPTCSYQANRLWFMIDKVDHSGEADWPGPIGVKVMLWFTRFTGDGCGQSMRARAGYYAANDTFRSHSAGFNCTSRNVYQNEITSPDPITITAGTYTGDIVVPLYWGGTITLRPVC